MLHSLNFYEQIIIKKGRPWQPFFITRLKVLSRENDLFHLGFLTCF